jgi:hypothetical protein
MQSEKKRGRPSSDVKATITGVSIDQPRFRVDSNVRSMAPRTIDESETIDVTERDQ